MVGDASPETNGSMGLVVKVANNPLGSFQMTNKRGSTVAAEGHDSIGNIKATKGDGPLEGTNETLKLDSVLRRTGIRHVQLGMVTLGQWHSMFLVGFFSKQIDVVLTHALDVSLGTIAKASILVSEEVSSKVVLGEANTLEFVVPGVGLESLHEFLRVFHGNKQIINIGANILIFVACITQPHIRIGKGGLEAKGAQGVCKLLMESRTRAL